MEEIVGLIDGETIAATAEELESGEETVAGESAADDVAKALLVLEGIAD